ncbi:MAG: glycosyltransferase family A protein [Vicinamibacterales bacterium]
MPSTSSSRQDLGWRELREPAPLDRAALSAALALPPRSVSIIINNFNYERYLHQAIASALAQTHPAQVVVVDDASTDGSRRVIEAFGEQIVAVLKTSNGGQASAMNEGVSVATGDIVIFLDSDDYLAPDAVETLLAVWRPGTAMAQYPLTLIDAEGRPIGVYPDPPSGLPDGNVLSQLLSTGSFVTTVTTGLAFARPALSMVMPIPTQPFRYAADGYLTRAVAFHGSVQRIDAQLGCYRKHGRNDADVCSAPGGLAQGFRKKITHADNEFRTTRECALKNGYTVPPNLGDGDPDYLGYRLFSLLLDPAAHPIAGDRRLSLLVRYVAARARSTWRLQRKLLAIGLATAASLGTGDRSQMFVRWLHDPQSRPSWFPSRASGRV